MPTDATATRTRVMTRLLLERLFDQLDELSMLDLENADDRRRARKLIDDAALIAAVGLDDLKDAAA